MESFQIYATGQSKWSMNGVTKIAKHANDSSQDSLNEFNTTLCQNDPQKSYFNFSQIHYPKLPPSAINKENEGYETDNKS